MRFSLFVLGLLVSAIYIFVVGDLVWDRLLLLKVMELNEVGDFFAGVFGPLAILWLVLGFLQQGWELSQSTAALRLQAEELRSSVQQQKELVEVTREQMKAEIDSMELAMKPIFLVYTAGNSVVNGKYTLAVEIRNVGNFVDNVVVCRTEVGKEDPFIIIEEHIGRNDQIKVTLFERTAFPAGQYRLEINYRMLHGKSGVQKFSLALFLNGTSPMAQIVKLND